MARSGIWILVENLKNDRDWVWTCLRVQPLDDACWYFGSKFEFWEVTDLWIVNAAARWRAWGFGGKFWILRSDWRRLSGDRMENSGSKMQPRDRRNRFAFDVHGSAAARWRLWSFIDLGREFEFWEVIDVVREACTCFWVQPPDEARART